MERLGVENSLSFHIYRQGRRKIIVNGAPVTLRQHVGSVNIVCFSPEDLYLVKGAPAVRRRFLDAELSQASAAYFHDFDEYVKILNQRNSLLKSIREKMTGLSDDEYSSEGCEEVIRPRASGKKRPVLTGKAPMICWRFGTAIWLTGRPGWRSAG